MSADNGVIRIKRKGLKKFAFGNDAPFEVDVIVAFQEWIGIDDEFRPDLPNAEGNRPIPVAEKPKYHEEARAFVTRLATPNEGGAPDLTVAEALDFIARLREAYDELLDFFQPKSLVEPDSPATSQGGLTFSREEAEQS